MIHIEQVRREHVPNAPRTHNAVTGQKLDEPVQCRKDLEVWPCTIRQLLDLIESHGGVS